MEHAGEELVLPPEFSGPAQLILYTRYGDPREVGWEHKWIVNWHVPRLAVHSWGAAIDLNEPTNPRGSLGSWSDEFIKVMVKNGVHCGQEWSGVKDPMHFAMADGE